MNVKASELLSNEVYETLNAYIAKSMEFYDIQRKFAEALRSRKLGPRITNLSVDINVEHKKDTDSLGYKLTVKPDPSNQNAIILMLYWHVGLDQISVSALETANEYTNKLIAFTEALIVQILSCVAIHNLETPHKTAIKQQDEVLIAESSVPNWYAVDTQITLSTYFNKTSAPELLPSCPVDLDLMLESRMEDVLHDNNLEAGSVTTIESQGINEKPGSSKVCICGQYSKKKIGLMTYEYELHSVLYQITYKKGDSTAALKAFEKCVRRLRTLEAARELTKNPKKIAAVEEVIC